MIIISIISISLASICNAFMDVLQFKMYESKLKRFTNNQWWNPEISWKNKWEWHPLFGYGKIEKFYGSSTIFVFITDAWHFFQFLMTTFIAISIATFELKHITGYYDVLLWILIIKAIWGLGFEFTYKYLTK